MNLHEMHASGMVGASGYGSDAYLYQVQPYETLPMLAERFRVTPDDILLANPEKPRKRMPWGWTFADIGFGEPLWLPPWITIPMGVGDVGVGALPTLDRFDWTTCTYKVETGVNPIDVATYLEMPNGPPTPSLPGGSPVSNLSKVNGDVGTAAGQAAHWIPNSTVAKLLVSDCNTGRKKNGLPPITGCDGANVVSSSCVVPGKGGGTTTGGLQQAGMFGSLGLLLLAGLGIGLFAMASGRNKTAAAHGGRHAMTRHRGGTHVGSISY